MIITKTVATLPARSVRSRQQSEPQLVVAIWTAGGRWQVWASSLWKSRDEDEGRFREVTSKLRLHKGVAVAKRQGRGRVNQEVERTRAESQWCWRAEQLGEQRVSEARGGRVRR